MKKFDTLQELPQCDTGPESEHTLLGKRVLLNAGRLQTFSL